MIILADTGGNWYTKRVKKKTNRDSHRNWHLSSDTSVNELMDFAIDELGLNAKWFRDEPGCAHFDCFGKMVQKAIDAGAVVLPIFEFNARCVFLIEPEVDNQE